MTRGGTWSRSRSTHRPGPGRERTPTWCPRGSATWRRASRCWCRSGAAAGRRSGWSSVPAMAPASGELRPIAARVRSDGPLLPPLAMAFAGVLADRYLAPLAMVIRAMLPPGMLERLELVAEVTPAGETRLGAESPGLAIADVDLLDELAGRSRPVRELATPEGRASLLRRLRALAADGLVDLTWTLVGAAVGPRFERRLWLTAAGVEAAATLRTGGRIAGRQPGRASERRSTPSHGAETGGTADRPGCRSTGLPDPRRSIRRTRRPHPPCRRQPTTGWRRRRSRSSSVPARWRVSSAGACCGPRCASAPGARWPGVRRGSGARDRRAPRSPRRRRLPSSSSGRRSTPGIRRRSCSTGSPVAARRRSTSRDWWHAWPPDGGRSCWSRRSPSRRRSWTACGRSCPSGWSSSIRALGKGSAPTNGGESVPATPTSWSARGPRCWPRSMTWA